MSPQEFAEEMRATFVGDTEGDHSAADKLMCALLRELGYGEGVEIFERAAKWYA